MNTGKAALSDSNELSSASVSHTQLGHTQPQEHPRDRRRGHFPAKKKLVEYRNHPLEKEILFQNHNGRPSGAAVH